MHDNAPPHKAAFTKEVSIGRNIEPIVWLALSPDLNPVEALWSQTKDYIKVYYPDLEHGRERTSAELRAIILEAWDSNSPKFLENFVRSMSERCQTVLETNGSATRF
ncbi:hypothetical protein K3495_g11044 [Podosphaera aphanis]|nr:hypothetical protein K3495_g11044 [Podosphaera aphanis]